MLWFQYSKNYKAENVFSVHFNKSFRIIIVCWFFPAVSNVKSDRSVLEFLILLKCSDPSCRSIPTETSLEIFAHIIEKLEQMFCPLKFQVTLRINCTHFDMTNPNSIQDFARVLTYFYVLGALSEWHTRIFKLVVALSHRFDYCLRT